MRGRPTSFNWRTPWPNLPLPSRLSQARPFKHNFLLSRWWRRQAFRRDRFVRSTRRLRSVRQLRLSHEAHAASEVTPASVFTASKAAVSFSSRRWRWWLFPWWFILYFCGFKPLTNRVVRLVAIQLYAVMSIFDKSPMLIISPYILIR